MSRCKICTTRTPATFKYSEGGNNFVLCRDCHNNNKGIIKDFGSSVAEHIDAKQKKACNSSNDDVQSKT